MTDRLTQQFAFLNEADRLKSVLRATTLVDGSRRENRASIPGTWHYTPWYCQTMRPRMCRSTG